jgi:hypothetical protein
MLLTPGCSRDPGGGIAQCEPSRWTSQVTILSGKREAQRHADGTGPNDRDGRRRPPTRACTHKSRIVSKLNPFRYPADCRLKPDIACGTAWGSRSRNGSWALLRASCIQSSYRPIGNEILLRQHRSRRARHGASRCCQQVSLRLSARESVGAYRRGSRC